MQRKRQGLRNPVNLTIDSVADVRAPPQPLALSHPSLEGQDETTLETNYAALKGISASRWLFPKLT